MIRLTFIRDSSDNDLFEPLSPGIESATDQFASINDRDRPTRSIAIMARIVAIGIRAVCLIFVGLCYNWHWHRNKDITSRWRRRRRVGRDRCRVDGRTDGRDGRDGRTDGP